MAETDPRGFVQRHFRYGVPMWRVKVDDGYGVVATHFVPDWTEAMRIANDGVRRLLQDIREGS